MTNLTTEQKIVLLSIYFISGKGQNFIFPNQHFFNPDLTNPAMAASTTPESTKKCRSAWRWRSMAGDRTASRRGVPRPRR